jgi:hypothetical protein
MGCARGATVNVAAHANAPVPPPFYGPARVCRALRKVVL